MPPKCSWPVLSLLSVRRPSPVTSSPRCATSHSATLCTPPYSFSSSLTLIEPQTLHRTISHMMMSGIHPVIIQAIHAKDPDVSVLKADLATGMIRTSSGNAYYFKIGSPGDADQYCGEAEALKAMHIAATGLAPKLVALGVIDEEGRSSRTIGAGGKPYFVAEYKDMQSLTDYAASKLGKRLATEVHMFKSTHGFGFSVPTYCGNTRQDNGWYETWGECYDALIGSLVTKLEKKGQFQDLCAQTNLVRKRVIPQLLGRLTVQPVLLHGDLWSGNTGVDKATGEPVIFDPASYFGHNEADLAIARIFGGIPGSFFRAYHEYMPKTEPQDQYEQRGDLYELYHYLNHALLFGGSYSGCAMRKIDRLLKAFPET